SSRREFLEWRWPFPPHLPEQRSVARTESSELHDIDDPARFFKPLVDASPWPAAIVGAGGKILLVNRAFERLFSYESGDLAGRVFSSLFPHRLAARLPDLDAATPNLPRPGQPIELSAVRKDGGDFPAEVGFNAVASLGTLFCTIADITSRRATEAALRNTEAQY